jgi:hypothetical protein
MPSKQRGIALPEQHTWQGSAARRRFTPATGAASEASRRQAGQYPYGLFWPKAGVWPRLFWAGGSLRTDSNLRAVRQSEKQKNLAVILLSACRSSARK